MNPILDCLQIPVLKSLGPWESAAWLQSSEKLPLFEAAREGNSCPVVTAYLIRGEDGEIWKACHAMLADALKMAAVGLQGFYGFDMIAMELENGIQNFRFQDLTRLLINHARKMETGQPQLIQYGGLFGIFKKRVAEEWGKVDFKSCVRIERRAKDRLDLVLKGLAREALAAVKDRSTKPSEGDRDRSSQRLGGPVPVILAVSDLSMEALYSPEDQAQAARLAALFLKLARDHGSLGQIIYRHQGKNVKLWPDSSR